MTLQDVDDFEAALRVRSDPWVRNFLLVIFLVHIFGVLLCVYKGLVVDAIVFSIPTILALSSLRYMQRWIDESFLRAISSLTLASIPPGAIERRLTIERNYRNAHWLTRPRHAVFACSCGEWTRYADGETTEGEYQEMHAKHRDEVQAGRFTKVSTKKEITHVI